MEAFAGDLPLAFVVGFSAIHGGHPIRGGGNIQYSMFNVQYPMVNPMGGGGVFVGDWREF